MVVGQCMNVPKANKKGRPNLRTQVRAPKGRTFVGFDFAQLEARVIAMLSGDPWLVGIFQNGKDIHTEMARIVWPNFDQLEPSYRKELRDMVKRPEYGAFYGGAVENLWKAVVKDYPKVKLVDISKMVDAMKARMPKVTAWQQACIAAITIKKEIRSFLYGRRRSFPLANGSPSEAINVGVQSAGADIMAFGLQRCMAKLKEMGLDAELILQVHDACVFECPEEIANTVYDVVKEAFTQEHTYNGVTMKFPVDCKIAPSWDQV
jgi:DNA polymerase-1